ncbi:MAG: pilus assembly protein [Brevundimonas sp.]|nr:MAG: pilus assembly protein [Brevundimonas sp.]
MVALPFCLMIFAILEVGLVFVTDSILENATIETGRLIRTGRAAGEGLTSKETFKAGVCSRMSFLESGCDARMDVDVRVIQQFAPVTDPLKNGRFDPSQTSYTNGLPGNLVLVRVWYRQPLVTGFMTQGLHRQKDGTARLTATTTFRNEPQ